MFLLSSESHQTQGKTEAQAEVIGILLMRSLYTVAKTELVPEVCLYWKPPTSSLRVARNEFRTVSASSSTTKTIRKVHKEKNRWNGKVMI
jgi:hypothetical protein